MVGFGQQCWVTLGQEKCQEGPAEPRPPQAPASMGKDAATKQRAATKQGAATSGNLRCWVAVRNVNTAQLSTRQSKGPNQSG